jgi:hypothetical protein
MIEYPHVVVRRSILPLVAEPAVGLFQNRDASDLLDKRGSERRGFAQRLLARAAGLAASRRMLCIKLTRRGVHRRPHRKRARTKRILSLPDPVINKRPGKSSAEKGCRQGAPQQMPTLARGKVALTATTATKSHYTLSASGGGEKRKGVGGRV